MLNSRPRRTNWAAAWIALALLAVLPACSVNVKEHSADNKRVDIDTPVGGIHVSKDTDPRDIGLEVYPGARKKEGNVDGDEKGANVNISGPGFGVRVIAQEYESDDSPEKLISFYKDQLKRYGSVLECKETWHGGSAEMHKGGGKDEDGHKPVSCGSDKGDSVELKVGTEDNQHIVAVKTEGKVSTFALVYVRTHGSSDTI